MISLMVSSAFFHSIYLSCPLVGVGAVMFGSPTLLSLNKSFKEIGSHSVDSTFVVGTPLYYVAAYPLR